MKQKLIEKETMQTVRIYRYAHGLFLLLVVYMLLRGDIENATINLGIALIFDPFDQKSLRYLSKGTPYRPRKVAVSPLTRMHKPGSSLFLHKTILLFGCSTGGKSVSPSISLISISTALLI